MIIPLSFMDLGLWVAISAIILLITSELLSPYYGEVAILIDRRRLGRVALGLGVFFLFFVAVRVVQILVA